MTEYEESSRCGACPWCKMPPSEHEIRDGYLHRIYLCENAPRGWRGVFTDQPVSR